MSADPASSDRLTTSPLQVLGQFADASNTTLLVRLADDTDPTSPGSPDRSQAPEASDGPDVDPTERYPARDLAVYKPVHGQRPLWDFDATTLSGREVATAVVDARLGFDLVPPTVWRDQAPLGPGSVQAYVEHDREEHWFTWVEDEDTRDRDTMARLVVLDLVINNTDRKGGHVLVASGRIWAIDHGVTFHVDDKLRTVAWELQGEPIPADLRQRCAALADWLVSEPVELAPHLTADEIAATRRRAVAVAATETFPPLVDRSQLPWPLV